MQLGGHEGEVRRTSPGKRLGGPLDGRRGGWKAGRMEGGVGGDPCSLLVRHHCVPSVGIPVLPPPPTHITAPLTGILVCPPPAGIPVPPPGIPVPPTTGILGLSRLPGPSLAGSEPGQDSWTP